MQVLNLMELGSLRNSVVGLPGVNGLSVEQRKRLTIGVELVANPGEWQCSTSIHIEARSSNKAGHKAWTGAIRCLGSFWQSSWTLHYEIL